MASSQSRKGYALFLMSIWSTVAAGIAVDICASFNTADMARNVSIYQTNGLCHDYCIDKQMAFAITQENGCWCSDYFPDKASTTDVTKCNNPCPAWPSEYCGGPDLFGYIELNDVSPSGTKSASASTATETASSTQARIETVTASVTKTVQATVTSTSTSTTSETPTTSPSSSSSTSPPSSSQVQTLTDGGTIRTVTLLPTQSSVANGDGNQTGVPVHSSGLKTGAIVGIVVGIVAAMLAFAGAALFWFLRRRRQNQGGYREDPSVRGSSSGMIGSIRPEMSMNGGTPASPGSAGNRNSAIQIDPRMDPFKQGLYARTGSHESINTLGDEHDYSRRIQPPKVLRAVNPDPE